MFKQSYLLTVIICFFLFTTPIFGQSTQAAPASGQSTQAAPAPASEGWRVHLTPYVWGSDFKGRVGIGDRSANVDASFKDILKEANFAFMLNFEASRNKFTTVTDLVYLNLSDEHATPGPLFSGAEAINKTFLLSPEAGYRIVGSDSSFLDVLGGIRFWHVNGELKLQPGILSAIGISDSRNWVDGIFGLRGKARLSPTWSLTGYGDIGGGGSNLTYQIVGTAAADIGKHYAIVLGYRYLNVDYNKDRFLFDTGMGGPIIGFTFKF